MQQRIYDLKKTAKIIVTGFEARNSFNRNTAKHGVFFNFYSRPCGKTKDNNAWSISHGQQIPNWVVLDIARTIIENTKNLKQLEKIQRLFKKTERLRCRMQEKNTLELKQEVKLAFDIFKETYGKEANKIKGKKVSLGITKLYQNIMFSADLKEVKKFHNKFFGYLKKSKNAKEKWT